MRFFWAAGWIELASWIDLKCILQHHHHSRTFSKIFVEEERVGVPETLCTVQLKQFYGIETLLAIFIQYEIELSIAVKKPKWPRAFHLGENCFNFTWEIDFLHISIRMPNCALLRTESQLLANISNDSTKPISKSIINGVQLNRMATRLALFSSATTKPNLCESLKLPKSGFIKKRDRK